VRVLSCCRYSESFCCLKSHQLYAVADQDPRAEITFANSFRVSGSLEMCTDSRAFQFAKEQNFLTSSLHVVLARVPARTGPATASLSR
jgi:hypothetical protein